MKTVSIGRCIYCLSPNASIAEHVIPKSLGGKATMQKASCLKCADRTSLIIGRLTEGTNSLFGRARIMFDFPSREKHKRPEHFPQTIIDPTTGLRKDEIVPIKDLVDIIILPILPLPTIVSHEEIVKPISTRELLLLNPNSHLAKQRVKYEMHGDFNVPDFALLVALIGYCYAVYKFGLDKCIPSPIPNLILGKSDDIGRWVGTARENILPTVRTYMQASCFEPNGHIVSYIKFFSWLEGQPEYIVVVKE